MSPSWPSEPESTCLYTVKGILQVWLRVLEWGDCPTLWGYSMVPVQSQDFFIRMRVIDPEIRSLCDTRRATRQRMQVACSHWKRQE